MGNVETSFRAGWCSRWSCSLIAALVTMALASGFFQPISLAQGATLDFTPNRDANGGAPSFPPEDHYNRGSSTSTRVGKSSNQDYYFADWDTAAIKAFIEAQVGPVSTIADLSNVNVELWVKANGGFGSGGSGNKTVNVRTLNSTSNNWVEGNGSSSSAYNWSSDNDGDPNNGDNGFAATAAYARDYKDSTGTPQPGFSVPWQNASGANVATFYDVTRSFNNSQQLVLLDGNTTTHNSVLLDKAIVLDLLNSSLNIGLTFSGGDGQNVTMWTREAAVGDRPFLRVTATAVPEPGAWALMALGAAGLTVVARRRYAVR